MRETGTFQISLKNGLFGMADLLQKERNDNIQSLKKTLESGPAFVREGVCQEINTQPNECRIGEDSKPIRKRGY
jgi:hypothetical protein